MVNKVPLVGLLGKELKIRREAHNKRDLTGMKFGLLTVVREVEQRFYPSGNRTQWECGCECGNLVNVLGNSLTTGNTRSCGCLQKTLVSRRLKTHGMTNTKVYRIWQTMVSRCNNEKATGFHNYGGRGISVCGRWMEFEKFLNDMGLPPPKTSIDRIDNDGDYCQENCRWATRKEQAQNKRNNRNIYFNGKNLCLIEWARKFDMDQSSMGERLDKWSIERALTEPKQRCANVKSM